MDCSRASVMRVGSSATAALFASALSGDAVAQEVPAARPPMLQPTVDAVPTAYVRLGGDFVGSLRYRALGSEYLTPQLDARVAWTRAIGRFILGAHASVARGSDIRQDVDGEAGVLAAFAIAPRLRIGGEARARGELVDRFATIADDGRPVEVLAGGLVGIDVTRSVCLQTTAGWMAPRGLVLPGPAMLSAATFTF